MRTEEVLALGMFERGSRLGDRIEVLLEPGRVFSPRASRVRVAVSAVALIGCLVTGSLAPRLIAFAQAKPAFEVASVRAVKLGAHAEQSIEPSPGGLTMRSVNFLGLVMWAYHIGEANQVSGPDWIHTQDFDVTAKTAGAVSTDQLRLMLQTLLEERFKMTLHREQKIVPLYSLLVDKNGPNLHPVQDEPQDGGRIGMTDGVFKYQMVNHVSKLAGLLPVFLDDRPVQDKTGLTGVYDITLAVEMDPEQIQRMPQPGVYWAGFGYTSGIFDAVAKLGLKLEATKGPVDYLVIDHVEKADAN